MAEDIKIGIQTALKGTGLDEAEKKLDEVGDAAEKASDALHDVGRDGKAAETALDGIEEKATEASRSMAKMEDEVRDLESALKKLDPSSLDFQRTAEDLGRVRLELQQTGERADDFARKSGGATGSARNLGGAFLEVSRAAEDAQYGLGGVVNNIPGLVTMLGGSAGLTAVISLLAVGINLWVKNMDKAKDSAKEKEVFEELGEEVKKLDAQFKQFWEGRNGKKDTLASLLEKDAAALDKETAAIVRNIERLKERVKLQGEIRAQQQQNELTALKGKEERGEISKQDGETKRAAIEEQMRTEEIARLKLLGELDIKVYEAKLQQAQAELKSAEGAKAAADKQTEAVQAIQDKVDKLNAAIKASEQLQQLQAAGGREAGKFMEPFMDIAERRRKMDELEKDIQGVGFPGQMGSNPSLVPVLQSQLQKAKDELEGLAPDVAGVSEALRSAREKLEDAQRNLADAQEKDQGAGDKRDVEGLGGALQRAQDNAERAGDEAGKEISGIFETWVRSLGDSAQQGDVAKLIEVVRAKVGDGIQDGELQQILQIAQEIAGRINRVTNTSSQAFAALSNSVGTLDDRMSSIVRTVRALEQKVGDASKEK